MNFATFKQTLDQATPPGDLSNAVQALWQDAKGDWGAAHKLVQACEGEATCDWVHAYLHRKEGDLSNAGHWYRRAGKAMSSQSLEAEWEAIAQALLAG